MTQIPPFFETWPDGRVMLMYIVVQGSSVLILRVCISFYLSVWTMYIGIIKVICNKCDDHSYVAPSLEVTKRCYKIYYLTQEVWKCNNNMLLLITVRGVPVLTPGVNSYCICGINRFNINHLREIFYKTFVAMDFNED